MRKLSKLFTTAALVVTLGACSATASPEGNVQNQSDLTLKEVFDKSQKADAELNSFHMEMNLEQDIHEEASENGPMKMSTNSSSDIVLEPLTMHQTSSVNMSMDDTELSEIPVTQLEMYLGKEAIYMKENMQNQWTKLPNEMAGLLNGAAFQESSLPKNQLQQYEPYLDQFTFTQDENSYILQLALEGEEADKLLKEGMSIIQGELEGTFEGIMDDTSLLALNLKVSIDKESFHTTAMEVEQVIEMGKNGDITKMNQMIDSQFSNFNELESIVIPAEVTEAAVEMNSMFDQ
ncbi:DUF6612 family protein [Bacillus sp. AK031]